MRTNFKPDLLKKIVSKVFSDTGNLLIEPAEEGISTDVYRIKKNKEVFYLRIASWEDESFESETFVHQVLLDKGVKIPEIIYYENFNKLINRSFMIVTEVKGRAISRKLEPEKLKNVLFEAGKDLAVINSIPVKGFGRLKGGVKELEGKHKTRKDALPKDLDKRIKLLIDKRVFNPKEGKLVSKIIEHFQDYSNYEQAYLSHGDFDNGHIYHREGQYTGIIDFGDIGGESPYFDLAHFTHFGDSTPEMFSWLLDGYKAITPIPDDFEIRFHLDGLFFAFNKLMWIIENFSGDPKNHSNISAIKEDIKILSSYL